MIYGHFGNDDHNHYLLLRIQFVLLWRARGKLSSCKFISSFRLLIQSEVHESVWVLLGGNCGLLLFMLWYLAWGWWRGHKNVLLGVIILSPNSLFDLQAHLIFANISLLLIAMLYVCQANALIDRLFLQYLSLLILQVSPRWPQAGGSFLLR